MERYRSYGYSASEAALLNQEQFRSNFACITQDIEVLSQLFMQELPAGNSIVWPEFSAAGMPYAEFCRKQDSRDRLLISLCLASNLFPEKLWDWIGRSRNGIALTNLQLGGYIATNTSRFIPSLKTAIHLTAGVDQSGQIESRKHYQLFSPLIRNQIVRLTDFLPGEPVTDYADRVPIISEEHLHYLLYGREVRPDFGTDFPGQLVTTSKEWEDLTLLPATQTQVNNIGAWLKYENAIDQSLGGKFRKGFTCLFYGAPGTGKTLAGVLLGKKYSRKVFRVDLAMTVDKYIGETEKKLSNLFDRMEMFPGSILLFDESDVIFGKRTAVGDSKDRWANLLTGFLLQRVETYNGMCILTSNRKGDIDEAMLRRFDAVVQFKIPTKPIRIQLWRKFLPPDFSLAPDVDVDALGLHELSGGQIENVMKWGVISAVVKESKIIHLKYLNYFIALEFAKYGLTLPNISRSSIKSET